MKKYFVMIQDEWNNLYYIGQYNTLEEAIPDVNDFLETYNVQIKELTEYPSTFGMCFDKSVEVDEFTEIMIRGFIF